jgi:hypothetical protein
MTIGSHELALTIINDGAGYKDRCKIARDIVEQQAGAAPIAFTAQRWLDVAKAGARAYERQFGSHGVSCFAVGDILQAACELADYYDRHVRETMALEEIERRASKAEA